MFNFLQNKIEIQRLFKLMKISLFTVNSSNNGHLKSTPNGFEKLETTLNN